MASPKPIRILDRRPGLKLEWLRTFVAVVDAGGFTKAARAIRLSQPAVSTQVKELERTLGTELFDHTGGRTRPTDAGLVLAREARRLLELAQDLPAAVAEAGGSVQGTLALAASTTPGNYLLPDLMSRFEETYPKARASLIIGNTAKILDCLHANQADLGFVGLKPDAHEYAARPFFDDEIVAFAAAGHRLAKARRLRLDDLLGERLVVREATSATRRLWERWLARHDARPPLMELSCPETVKRAVAAGLGVGILSRHAISWEVREGRLVELPVPGFPIKRPLYVVHHRGKHLSRTIRAFLDLLDARTR